MSPERLSVRVEGLVQGVGFRPFVHSLATRLRLTGHVANDTQGALVEVEGEPDSVQAFLDALEREAPPLSVIERVTARPVRPLGDRAFVIAPSRAGGGRAVLVSPDVGTCEDCLREVFDPADRRFRYPFTNCTNCGPRFTIIRDVPYDRPTTTMAAFPMCADCAREYGDPADRRFHAQPVACPACGPRLVLLDGQARPLDEEPLAGAVRRLRAGEVVAVKGLGGYHLAADAASEAAVSRLRARKHREEKPFAVLVPDLDTARRLAEVSAAEERLLASPRRPIVLLRRRADAPVAAATAPGNRYLGLLLPYTPLHHLLARELGGPAVLTSGNVSDEPIAYVDAEAQERLGGLADAFLAHDRAIHIRTDDSVVRVFRGAALPLRRARGYAPQPIRVAGGFPRPTLGCGAELKSTVCLAKGAHAFLSQHLGDLENLAAYEAFLEAIRHLERLFDVAPAVVAHDLHPEYLSTKWAREQDGVELVAVQHHHAHVASCLADNAEEAPVIGVAFDGLGYGPDGTLWGGEFLLADLAGFERLGRLRPVPMPGGAAAIREPWRMAAVYLRDALGTDRPELAVRRRHADRWAAVLEVARAGVNAPATSSAGRLFDAVAAVLGVRDQVSYEGQAAIELEQLADPGEPESYWVPPTGAAQGFEVRGADFVRAVVADLGAGVPAAAVAARFHNGLARTIAAGCEIARERTGVARVALSGGVFQNLLLLERAVSALEAAGFRVLRHRQVPPNDGGISLGQAVVASRARPG